VACVGDDAFFDDLDDALAAWTDGTTLTLLADLAPDAPLTVAAGRDVTLDLNGCVIDRGLTGNAAVKDGNVITVNGALTLTDSSATNSDKTDGTGTIA